MPLVRITIRAGKPPHYKTALLDGIHEALVQAFKIPDQDRHQVLSEHEQDHFEAPPGKSNNVTIIELTVFRGRSAEAKKMLYRTIVDNLAKAPGIPGDNITIVLHEPPMENWGIRGGQPANEVHIGFKVDV